MKNIILVLFFCISFLHANQISQSVFKKLQNAENYIQKQKFNEAKNLLENLLSKDLSNIEKSYTLQVFANLNIQKDNYKLAISQYEQILSLNAFKNKDLQSVKFSLSQLYLSEQKYKKGIAYSVELLNQNYEKKDTLEQNLALAYFYDKQYKNSIIFIKKIIDKKQDKTNWYKMLYSAYIELKDYKSAIDIMKYLIKIDNENQEYYLSLAALYQNTKNYKDALSIIEFAYENNILDKSKYTLYYTSLLNENGIYNKSAKEIEKNIQNNILPNNQSNFDILMQNYLNAKNYKITISKLNSSSFANTAKYKLILANIYYNKNDYESAIKTLLEYKFEPNSPSDGQKNIMLALSYYQSDDLKNTKLYLQKAMKNKHEKAKATKIAKQLNLYM